MNVREREKQKQQKEGKQEGEKEKKGKEERKQETKGGERQRGTGTRKALKKYIINKSKEKNQGQNEGILTDKSDEGKKIERPNFFFYKKHDTGTPNPMEGKRK